MFLANNPKRKIKWSKDVEVKEGSLTELLGAEPSTLSSHTIALRVLRRLKSHKDRVAALRKLIYVANLQKNKNQLVAKKFYDAAHEISRHLMKLERNPKRAKERNDEGEEIYCLTITYPKNTGFPKKVGDLVYVEVIDGNQFITYSSIRCARHMPRSWEWYPEWNRYFEDGVPLDAYKRWQCLVKKPKTRFEKWLVVEDRGMEFIWECDDDIMKDEIKDCSQRVCIKRAFPRKKNEYFFS